MDVPENHRQNPRVRLLISGVVQGVGFRPFVYQIASEMGIAGWVQNTGRGVVIEAEAPEDRLRGLVLRLQSQSPPNSRIEDIEFSYVKPRGDVVFEIRASDPDQPKTTWVLPDIATCDECLKEVFDPADRRYLYPFTNCTHCGPRYSIIEALPYDRRNTSMRGFLMCPRCQREYDDPRDRRFHAQPNACPECGPHLELWDVHANIMATRQQALMGAAEAIREGKVVAVKGVGGFHLMADAGNDDAVRALRARKRREEKPFALMFPSESEAERVCHVSPAEMGLLRSRERPIVLVRKKEFPAGAALAGAIAPGNPYLGVMLAYSPLHHILMNAVGAAVVATSANLAEEPICVDEREALARLSGIVDVFLVHNRPIVRSIDDSVARVVADRPMVLRRARGYAPLPVAGQKEDAASTTVLAVGAHLKNTVALNIQNHILISQHIGDLQTRLSLEAFRGTVESLKNFYALKPTAVVCDSHPEYLSTRFAQETGLKLMRVQHHHAHAVSCMAEHQLEGEVFAVIWDGTGLGPDGTVWGGEFLQAGRSAFSRFGHFKAFALPGGDKAAVEPRRVAAAILSALGGGEGLGAFADLAPVKAFSAAELRVLGQMIKRGVHTPLTSSVGRLFDAAASLLDIRQTLTFEGQAAMALEYLLEGSVESGHYEFVIQPGDEGALIVDWTLMFLQIIREIRTGTPPGIVARKFHDTMVEMAVAMAARAGENKVVLSGGCFQNKYLTERLITRLRETGLTPYWHEQVPPNDGGISLGQAACGISRLREK